MKRLSLAVGLMIAACGGGSDDDDIGELVLMTPVHCNPLGGTNCITPFPSGIYEIEDATTATGWRLDFPVGALPTSADDYPIDPTPFNQRDGFSAGGHIFTAFPGGVDGSALVSQLEFPSSVTDDSPTILIDMSTGERVVHFAELDVRAADTPDQQALYVRPAVRLKGGTRYAVGIRRTLKARDGSDLPLSEGFQALLDDTITTHPLLERVRPRYEEIFEALEGAGISRDKLLVAWDFTTASDESQTADLRAARDQALTAMGRAGTNLTFSIDDDGPMEDTGIARRINGTFDAPLFLTQDGAYAPGTVMARDADGAPRFMGMYQAPFTAIMPQCALEQAPVPILIYGHGLMGKAKDQVTSGAIRDAAKSLCMVVVGTDWRGMSEGDLPNIARALNDANNSNEIFEVLVQGIVNFIALEQIARGPMASELFVDASGASLVDAERVYYYGLSQGGIFGSTFMAYDPFITRGVVGVGGANYSMMLERSADWPTYRTILIGAYPNPLDVVILIYLMQMNWDRTDPVTTSPGFFDDPIADTPAKQLLVHMSVGDAEVPNLATEYQVRTMGLGVLSPAVYEPYGIPLTDAPQDGALVIWDGGFETPLTNATPLDEENEAHYVTRRAPAALRQMGTFYETGQIVHTCGAGQACDCTAGACE